MAKKKTVEQLEEVATKDEENAKRRRSQAQKSKLDAVVSRRGDLLDKIVGYADTLERESDLFVEQVKQAPPPIQGSLERAPSPPRRS